MSSTGQGSTEQHGAGKHGAARVVSTFTAHGQTHTRPTTQPWLTECEWCCLCSSLLLLTTFPDCSTVGAPAVPAVGLLGQLLALC
eukprot:COSAG01_NODE_2046_length_8561_cov_3.243441_1_plen_84_part_10